MHLSAHFLLALIAATCTTAVPSYSSYNDNAYPKAPGGVADSNQQQYMPPESTSTPCTTATPTPTTTPCETQPTAAPEGAESQQGLAPDTENRPTCPPPQTITLPPVVNTVTRTRTLHDVRTATVTSVTTAVVTKTKVKPEVEYRTVVKPPVTVTKTCTETSTVQKVVTSTKTCVETSTVQVYKTKVLTSTVTQDHYVTTTVGVQPTQEARPPAPSAYGSVSPAVDSSEQTKSDYPSAAPAQSAYPSASYAGQSPAQDDKSYNVPMYLPSGNQKSAYGY